MKQHGNAQLTVAQRRLVHELYHSGQAKKSELARRFNVNRKTIDRWTGRDDPQDRRSGPKNPQRVVTEEYRQAVVEHRKANSDHGPITIAHHVKRRFGFANPSSVYRILREEGLSGRVPKEKKSRSL